MLIAVSPLSPAQLEHVLGFTSFRHCFGGELRGRFVPRTWFDLVPAGTVVAGTRLFRTRSDYKKWCVPRTRWNPRIDDHSPNSLVKHVKVALAQGLGVLYWKLNELNCLSLNNVVTSRAWLLHFEHFGRSEFEMFSWNTLVNDQLIIQKQESYSN